ncbi:hypothetical protein [Streptomyces sp. NBC_00038]|uniref:hypothetical protein n=1 Tax=Streptomyces sp. NBC_00038 TaxID=2903615 RepID=UPI00225A3108|nr:hypothetical protein [Streptomyces sp. NBC_00038]MCX5563149.1 hypothetical protein [Streptomyces sp. NBC_00038]
MGLLVELQKRIPDGWFLRRLLPAALFVVVAAVGGGQLGQRRWDDLGLARERIAGALRLSGGLSADGAASLVLVAVAVMAAAFAVPFAAGAIGALASGAWPWWLMPLGRRLTAWRMRRWAHPEEIGREAVRSRAAGRQLRADRLDARRARTGSARPDSPTWSGDRFRATEAHVRAETGSEVASEWTRLLLAAPDTSRAALSEARDAYDAACEALAWSLAFIILGAWWWPAAPVGLLLWLASWGSLRRAVQALCRTTEAVFVLQHTDPPPQP